MKISTKFSFGGFGAFFARHTNAVFWLFLLILMAAEFFVVQKSYLLAKKAGEVAPVTKKPLGVRVNFEHYHEVEDRLNEYKTFTSTTTQVTNPFYTQTDR